MMHKAWSSIEEVPYCFARSSVKFQGRTALQIVEFDPDCAFPDSNSHVVPFRAMVLFILRFIPSGIIDLHISFITKWYVLVMAEMASGSSGAMHHYDLSPIFL